MVLRQRKIVFPRGKSFYGQQETVFLGVKRKLGVVKRFQKQIDNFGLTGKG
jgi:hypothetical protein